MVVKSATKKKLMDLGIEEEYAHKLADDRKWDDVKGLSPGQIAQICGIDSGTSQKIHEVMSTSAKSSRASAASTEKTIIRRRTVSRTRRRRTSLPLQPYDKESKKVQIVRDIDSEDEMYVQLSKAASDSKSTMTPKMIDELVKGCRLLQKNKCKFIVMPCNTAHYWYNDLQRKIKIPIISMPKEVFLHTKKTCKKNCKIGLLATEATINTKIYHNYLSRNFELVTPTKNLQKKCVNKAIQLVKSGKVKEAEKIIGPAVRYLIKIRCKKIILGCTEIPIAIFAYKSFKKAKKSKIFIDPNLLLANVCMRKYKGIKI